MLMIDEVKGLKKKGTGMAFVGVILIMIATYLYSLSSSNYLILFFETLLEPAGWFTAWTGMEDIYYGGRELNKELKFYERISNAEIAFNSY